jgi:hypothetical protein
LGRVETHTFVVMGSTTVNARGRLALPELLLDDECLDDG